MFGCDAYAHVPKDERGKFDSKTRKCVLVGYGAVTKGYRLFDVAEEKVIYSRDVHFNEEIKDCKDDGHKAGDSDTDYQLIIDLSSLANDKSDTQPYPEAPRKSTRERREPDYYGRIHGNLCEIHQQPVSFREAITSPDKKSGKLP